MSVSRRLARLSIRQKLTITSLLTTSFALFVAGVSFVLAQYVDIKLRSSDEVAVTAAFLADRIATALDFDEKDEASEKLRILSTQDNVIAAVVLDRDGKEFARYTQAGFAAPPPMPAVQRDGVYSDGRGGMYAFRTVPAKDGSRLGTVFVRAKNIATPLATALYYAGLLLAVFPVALIVSVFVARRLQFSIAGPIVHLALVTTRVRQSGDFSVRAVKSTDDELGVMIDGFNEMLEEIQKRDAELTVARDRAEEANRAKSAFLANMSHELRTPLNAILGYSEMLMEDAADSGQSTAVPDLQRINTAGKHLLTLINDILDLAKIEAGRVELSIEPFDVRQLAADVMMTIEPLAVRNKNTLRQQLAPDLGTMHADLTRVRQILLNLLSNATKFTEGGDIELSVSRVTVDRDDWLTFEISDTGIGLTDEQIGRLFQPFSQAHGAENRKYGGTGLGLVISRRLAAFMGGTITVRSRAGAGTTFTVRLPAHVRSDPSPASRETPRPAVRALVLAVDADVQSRREVVAILREGSFEVVEASDADEALRLARERRPAVVTLDVARPEVDGWRLLRVLRNDPTLSRTPLIVLTSAGAQAVPASLGAADCIVKPINPPELLHIIDKHVGAAATRSVLIVDDEMSTRNLIRKVLERGGYSVSEAENGHMALALLERWLPQLILLDLMMPEMDGFEFVAEMRRRPALVKLPVVVITSKDLTAEDYFNLEGRVEKVLRKGTYTRADLLAAVRQSVGISTGA